MTEEHATQQVDICPILSEWTEPQPPLAYWLNMCCRYDTDAGAMRLAAYSATRAAAVFALLGRMSILAESVELARATGLTLANVLYNAQVCS